MLIRLISHEIEGKPEAARMKLAIIPGFNVLVPQGKLVGGSFKSTPLCSRPGEPAAPFPGSASARRTPRRPAPCSVIQTSPE
jgi:hypothetical protein